MRDGHVDRTKMARFTKDDDDRTGNQDWLQTSVSSESLQTIMGFLSMGDRFALMQTSKWLMEEPITTSFTSFCGACAECANKNPHLCKSKDNQQPESFWTCLLKHSSGGALKEIHLASCDAFTADVLKTSPFMKQALTGLQVLDLNRCDTLGAEGVRVVLDSDGVMCMYIVGAGQLTDYCSSIVFIHCSS